MIDESWYRRPRGISEHISAGGVIARLENGQIHIALVREQAHSGYVLPKGHVDEGESLQQAARREIEEEAGLANLQFVAELGIRERLDFSRKSWKKTRYFLFATDQVEGVPTDQKRHDGVWWFPIGKLPSLFWPEQKELINTNQDRIQAVSRLVFLAESAEARFRDTPEH